MGRILRQTTVVRDGQHNAFTDLVYWKGLYWVSYRKGAGHVSEDGEAVLSVSADRHRFREVAHLKVHGDCRDPKLVPMGEEKLAMIFPSWVDGPRREQLQQHVAFSGNGFNWEEPVPILQQNRWLWRVRPHNGRYYGMTYGWRSGTPRKDRVYVEEFLVSDDMVRWKPISQIGTDDMKLGESDVIFQPDDEAWVISRSGAEGGLSYLSCAKPPYTEWDNTRLEYLIHSPVMLQHNGTIYVSGRRHASIEKDKTWPFLSWGSLGIWSVTRGAVEPVMRIPATGDCSYPGLIVDPEGRVCMSYYSQHAYDMGVVEYGYRREAKEPHDTGEMLRQNDVYFAEIELP